MMDEELNPYTVAIEVADGDATDDAAYAIVDAIYDLLVDRGVKQERERIREALLSDGAVQSAYDAMFNPNLADADFSHMPEILAAALDHIGLGAVTTEENEK